MSVVYAIPGVRYIQSKLNQLTSYVPPPPKNDEREQPRRILLVHTHPVPGSFSAAISDMFETSAVGAGHEVQRVPLYSHDDPVKCYRPNLSRKERESYFDFLSGGKADEKALSTEVKTHLDLLRWCDTLVLVYPTWWMNTPASLKGFFDRTLVAGLTWDFPSEQSGAAATAAALGLAPKLTNIERIVGISTYGASQTIVTLAGDNGRRMISNAIRHSVCPDASVLWMGFYGGDTATFEQRVKFLKEVAKLSSNL